jgi:hypothetical protein
MHADRADDARAAALPGSSTYLPSESVPGVPSLGPFSRLVTRRSHRLGYPWRCRNACAIGARMIASPGFSVPHEIDEILDRLPARVTLNVPEDVLALWFPRASASGRVDAATLERARIYAHSCGCTFVFDQGVREGVFSKAPPSQE